MYAYTVSSKQAQLLQLTEIEYTYWRKNCKKKLEAKLERKRRGDSNDKLLGYFLKQYYYILENMKLQTCNRTYLEEVYEIF